MMTYKLIGITEQGFSVASPTLKSKSEEFVLGWDFNLNITYPKEGTIDLSIRASTVLEGREDRPSMSSILVVHHFEVEGIRKSHPKHATVEERNLLAVLLGVSLGTIRGLAYARTLAILGKNVFMPVVNPKDILDAAFPVIRS